MARKNRGKKTKSRKTPPFSTPFPPPPPMEPQAKAAKASIDVLADFDICSILRRLSLADLLRAALACHRWRRLAAGCLPRAPPLLGYFFHPTETPPPPPLPYTKNVDTPAVFVPLDASSPRLSLDFAPDAFRFFLFDSHQGLLLFEPADEFPKKMIPRFLVLDPSTSRRILLPPPPRDTVPDDRRWRNSRYYVGCALLSRARPGKLCFEVVCFAIDGGHPRAWVASVDNGDCSWRALPRDEEVVVEFDPYWFEGRCVHASGKIYWHICNSWRLLVLDPATLKFSCLLVPDAMSCGSCKYRIGETPDGRLCLVTDGEKQLQLWVRGEGRSSDNGWLLERRIVDLSVVCDMVPGLHRDTKMRTLRVWPSDMDAGRTGKVFIKTWGYGYYSFDVDTGKMESLWTKGGKEYGHPMFAYFLAWPPAFLAPEN
ncbi:hypothetical protein CFC21_065298 [Triticum aestivum]|uniref:F-box domain-containing protein n=3 Tax=Triticum TaxID=4564 RepID=A0A9R0WMS7_TRITD|nr:uncharacterized protein LOC123106882 [Triticum aestivum]KAF7058179.1 hypothetical protein CFC21_065298 [Triticum aestivum]VAI16160.1 unnamed protein product [Triticum turgidum subsp. durum]